MEFNKEDDLKIMSGLLNDVGYRVDDYKSLQVIRFEGSFWFEVFFFAKRIGKFFMHYLAS